MVRSYKHIISYGVNLTQKSSFDGRATSVYRHKLSLLMVKKSPLYFLRRNNVFQNDHPFKDNKQDCGRLISNSWEHLPEFEESKSRTLNECFFIRINNLQLGEMKTWTREICLHGVTGHSMQFSSFYWEMICIGLHWFIIASSSGTHPFDFYLCQHWVNRCIKINHIPNLKMQLHIQL